MLRKATQEETDFFHSKLYPLQDRVLSLIDDNNFYLTGGTCLSRFYYRHRFSEDLDLFYDGRNAAKEKFQTSVGNILQKASINFNISVKVADDYFRSVLVNDKETKLKIDFVFEPLPVIGELKKVNNIYIDSKVNIATNKITTVYNRKTVKDYFDLFYLLKEFSIEELSKYAEQKIVPLDYEGVIMATLKTKMEGEVLLSKEINENEFMEFMKNFQLELIDYARRS